MEIDFFDITGNYSIIVTITVIIISIFIFIIAFPPFRNKESAIDNINENEDDKKYLNKLKKSKLKVKENNLSNVPVSKILPTKAINKTLALPVAKKQITSFESESPKNKTTKKQIENEDKINVKDVIQEEWETAKHRRSKKKTKKEGDEEDVEKESILAVIEEADISALTIAAKSCLANEIIEKPIIKNEIVINEKIAKKKKSKEIAVSNISISTFDSDINTEVQDSDSNSVKENILVLTNTDAVIKKTSPITAAEQIEAASHNIEDVDLNENLEQKNDDDFSITEEGSKSKNKKKKKKTPESRSKYQESPYIESSVDNSHELDLVNSVSIISNDILNVSKNAPKLQPNTKNLLKKEKLKQKLNIQQDTNNVLENLLIESKLPQPENVVQTLHLPQMTNINLPEYENLVKVQSEKLLINGLPSSEEIGDWQAAKTIKKKKAQREI